MIEIRTLRRYRSAIASCCVPSCVTIFPGEAASQSWLGFLPSWLETRDENGMATGVRFGQVDQAESFVQMSNHVVNHAIHALCVRVGGLDSAW